jgi:AAA domain
MRCRLLAGERNLEAAAAVKPPALRDALDQSGLTRKQLLRAARQLPLNLSQAAAVALAATRTLMLWQGPPGTGKTRTLAAFVAFMRRRVLRGAPHVRLLACAGSNVAVDNLVDGMLALRVRVVRVGQPAKMSPALLGASFDAHAAAHPLGAHCRTGTHVALPVSACQHICQVSQQGSAPAQCTRTCGNSTASATSIRAGRSMHSRSRSQGGSDAQ